MWPKNYSIVALKTILIARTVSVSLPVLPIIMPTLKTQCVTKIEIGRGVTAQRGTLIASA